ncbi:MAG: hypothetical protein QOC65_655 [Sphingomonadales bacterium]|nr:hypothetical protein [Sphingomonadales bacterium]
MASIRDIQQALADKGFDTGGVDGVWGRKSIAAARAFQAAKGLTADGVVGPRTLAALFPGGGGTPASGGGADTGGAPAVWYEEAKNLLGLREGPAARDNPTILDWADDLDIHYPHDDIPWCGLFVAHCVGSTLPDEPLPTNPLGARNWAKFGVASPVAPGAILVFWRESPAGFKGHVGLYHGEDDTAYHVLGGNQGDSVSVTRVAKNRLVSNGIRRPASFPALAGGVVRRKADGTLSSNEA